MALYVKDPEVDRMAERVSRIGRISKTEAVRRALRHELERLEAPSDRTERILALTRDLKKRAGPNPQPADKAWIDSLYE
ncbi:MAG: type II toxin-antitoxin system VapB family antitoxin [Brevundimonas sp.]